MASSTLTNWFGNKTGINPVQNPNANVVANVTGALGIKPVTANNPLIKQQTNPVITEPLGLKPAGATGIKPVTANNPLIKQQQPAQTQPVGALGIKPVTANNPLIKQQAAQTQQQAIIAAKADADSKLNAAKADAAKAKAFNATGTYQASTADPKLLGKQTQWNVGNKETVQGQAADIISKDSPLMQLARRQAMEQSGARGLLNSSAGIGAATDAVIGRALEIANPDAATYSRAHGYNVDTSNTFNKTNTEAINNAREFNANAKNAASQFGAGNQFTRQQNAIQQGYTEKNKGLDQKYNLQTIGAQQKNTLQLRDVDQDNTKELAKIQQGYSVDNTKLDFTNSLKMAATNQGYTLAQKDVDNANLIARDATMHGYEVKMANLTNNFTTKRDAFAAKVQKDLQDDTQKFNTSERTASEKFTANQKIIDGNIASGLETLKHEYNLTENQQGIVGELAKGMGTYIMNIQTNPDMQQSTKDFLINQGWGDFKASVKMISNVGKIPDVGELLKVK